MNRIILLMLAIATTLTGCISEPNIETTYIYGNATDKQISVRLFFNNEEEKTSLLKQEFQIEPGAAYMNFLGGERHLLEPFDIISWEDYYVVVSNGEKQFIQWNLEGGKLFYKENYELISKGENGYTYKYTFTDEDFRSAKPIG